MNYKIFIVIIAVLAIVAIGGYFYATSLIKLPSIVSPANPPATSQNTSVDSDTTADITNDLNQGPSDAVVDDELNSLNQDLSSF